MLFRSVTARVTTPAQEFGAEVGDDYFLATYSQLEAYWKKLDRESDRMSLVDIGRTAEGRTVTSAHVGLHVGEVFYGNIGSDDRLDFTVVGPAVNEVSRIASMCRSVDRELLMSSAFRAGLDAAGRNYLVSTGRYALRGIGRAQDLYTLDPDIAADEVVAGKYERYLAG